MTTHGRAITLSVILGCQLMMVLDTSIVTTALPHLERELGFTAASLSWVQNGYALAFGGLLLLGARVGDLLGRRRVFAVGVAVFTVASVLAAVAPTAPVLIAARVLQGLASAVAVPATLALLVQSFPEPAERTRAIGVYSAVIGAGGSVGIIVGGVFTDLLSWRWGLLINLPIGLLVLVLTPRYLPGTDRRPGHFDLPGALAVTVGMAALVFGLVQAGETGWAAPSARGAVAGGLVLLGIFVLIERRARQPIVPLRLFLDPTRSGAHVIRILVVGAMFSTFYFLSQYLQNVLGFGALQAGLSYIPLTLMFFLMVQVVRWIGSRVAPPVLLVVSLVVATGGMWWLSTVGPSTSYFPGVLLPLVVLGIGQGIAIILLTGLGMSGVSTEDSGAASGLVNTAHQLGGSIGLALLTAVFTAAVPDGSAAPSNAYTGVFGAAVWFYVLAVAVAVVVAVLDRTTRRDPVTV